MAIETRLSNWSPPSREPVSVRNNASGDGRGILAAETGDRFGGQEAFRRPVVRRTCNPQPLSYGNHGLFGMDCKKAETARVVGGGERNRTDGHRDLASLRNEAAYRGFSARDDFTHGISNVLTGTLQALTMNHRLPRKRQISLAFVPSNPT